MIILPRVAIVGRPNVGKSRLFNRLAGKRLAIVHDQPGVTRDVMSIEIGQHLVLMDTGGIGMEPDMNSRAMQAATEEQVDFAIQAANLILFVVDGLAGCTALDEILAAQLRVYGKSILLVANKIDNPSDEARLSEFYSLGLGEAIAVSAEHGNGIDQLWNKVEERVGPAPVAEESDSEEVVRIPVCFAGRPNVGKSSICNRLLSEERMIVSNIPGTTRDAIAADFDYTAEDGSVWPFRLTDTAGLRASAKLSSSVEYFSSLRSREAMEQAEIVFLVLDALEGVTKLDKKIAGEALDFGVGLIVVVNKWDYALEQFRREPLGNYESEEDFRLAFEEAVRKELFFLPKSPIVFVSAKKGHGMEEILRQARHLHRRLDQKLSTARVNQTLIDLIERNPPRLIHKKRFKAYYALQTGKHPYRIRLYCNSTERLEDSYRRYLESGLEAVFDLRGCPIRIELIGKQKHSERPKGKRHTVARSGREVKDEG